MVLQHLKTEQRMAIWEEHMCCPRVLKSFLIQNERLHCANVLSVVAEQGSDVLPIY